MRHGRSRLLPVVGSSRASEPVGETVIAELMFSLEQAEHCDIRSQFGRQSWFIGECRADAAPDMDVRARRCQAGPVTLNHLRATTRTFFHRTGSHIAEDRADLAVLWFIRCGSVTFRDASGTWRARAGELALTRSSSPFVAECLPDAEGQHEALHVIFEADLLSEVRGDGFASGVWPAGRGPIAIGAALFTDVFENDGALQPESSAQLAETALQLVRQGLGGQASNADPVEHAGEQRLREIFRFIDVQLTNPRLSRAMAARHCQVSERHLATLLERQGTTFSEFVWRRRTERARQWLAASDAEVTIAEIAYGLGFKSAAHFTRKFRETYGVSPRVFRAEEQQRREVAP